MLQSVQLASTPRLMAAPRPAAPPAPPPASPFLDGFEKGASQASKVGMAVTGLALGTIITSTVLEAVGNASGFTPLLGVPGSVLALVAGAAAGLGGYRLSDKLCNGAGFIGEKIGNVFGSPQGGRALGKAGATVLASATMAPLGPLVAGGYAVAYGVQNALNRPAARGVAGPIGVAAGLEAGANQALKGVGLLVGAKVGLVASEVAIVMATMGTAHHLSGGMALLGLAGMAAGAIGGAVLGYKGGSKIRPWLDRVSTNASMRAGISPANGRAAVKTALCVAAGAWVHVPLLTAGWIGIRGAQGAINQKRQNAAKAA